MTHVRTARHVKVLFAVERDDGALEIESMWALPEAPGYRLDNIPFYARSFAWGDLVSAVPDPDGMLRCTGLLEPSGHSTIRLWFADAGDVQDVRNHLRALHCDSELDHDRLVAVDIPPEVSYPRIRDYLDEKERAGIFEYEEGCLAHAHVKESP